MSEPFIAEIRIFAGNFAPRGWAFCNGQLLPISQNTALFSLLGTTYGGDGRTTMALPDLQGRAPMHPGQGPGLTARQLGEIGGAETVTLNETQIPAHAHALRASNAAADEEGTTTAADNVPGEPELANQLYGAASNLQTMSGSMVPEEGGSQPHNNMQPFLAISFIIALVGIFPSRS